MEINREFKDESNRKVSITFNLSDDEIIELISKKPTDERVVFFRKLFQSDVKRVLTLKFLKQFI